MDDRRGFLKTATGGVLILKPETVFGSQANSTVEIGIVGVGGRGNWIGPFFPEYTGARIVALADVQKANLDSTREKFKVDAAAPTTGRTRIRNSSLPSSTPWSSRRRLTSIRNRRRPRWTPASMCTWPSPSRWTCPAARASWQSAKKAAGEEARPSGRLPVAGAAGVSGGGRARPSRRHRQAGARPGVLLRGTTRAETEASRAWTRASSACANFYMDKVLGGDIIVEQNIHVIDMANWSPATGIR